MPVQKPVAETGHARTDTGVRVEPTRRKIPVVALVAVTEILAHAADYDILTLARMAADSGAYRESAAEIHDLLCHPDPDTRDKAWMKLPAELGNWIVSRLPFAPDNEEGKEDRRRLEKLFSADEPAAQQTVSPGPGGRRRAPAKQAVADAPFAPDESDDAIESDGRRSPEKTAKRVMSQVLAKAVRPDAARSQLEEEFAAFIGRAYASEPAHVRAPGWGMQRLMQESVRERCETDSRLEPYFGWLSRRFYVAVASGQLRGTVEDWHDYMSEGHANLWQQFLRVWADKGDPSKSLKWNPRWDVDVRRLDTASLDSLARQIAQRRGFAPRLAGDRGSVSAYLQLRRIYVAGAQRPSTEPIMRAVGWRLGAMAFALYRKARACTNVRHGNHYIMGTPALRDVLNVWFDGETVAVHGNVPTTSLDGYDDPEQAGNTLGRRLSYRESSRQLTREEQDFAEQTLQYLSEAAGRFEHAYVYHVVSGVTRTDHWLSEDEFRRQYGLSKGDLQGIRQKVVDCLESWFESQGLSMDRTRIRRLLQPTEGIDRGVYGRDQEKILGLERVSAFKPVDPQKKEPTSVDEHLAALTPQERSRLESEVRRYHVLAQHQTATHFEAALEAQFGRQRARKVMQQSAQQTAWATTKKGALRDLLSTAELARVADQMRQIMHERLNAEREEMFELDVYFRRAWQQARQELLDGARIVDPRQLTPDEQAEVTELAVTIARLDYQRVLQGGAR